MQKDKIKATQKTVRVKYKRYVPPVFTVSFLCAALTFVLQIAAKNSPQTADLLNRTWGTAVRFTTSLITGWFSFSLAEGLLLFSPVLLFVLIRCAVRCARHSLCRGVRYICVLLSVICILYTLYVPSLGLGASVTPLAGKLGLTQKKVGAVELAETMKWTAEEANALCDEVDFAFAGASRMPFASYDEMCDDLLIGYDRLWEEYPIFTPFSSHIKPVILSEPMSYTHITGIYTFFTGEANLNVNFPDYTLPYTAAHEMAHQRGFTREKEANFIAFLVCINADDAYTRYSGYVNMTEYLSNALYSADKDLWKQVFYSLDGRIRYEMEAYNDFYEKYKDNTAADISNAVNDTYLKGQGQSEGTRSYGLVVELAVAFFNAHIRGN